jgi:hypothetical protein
LKIFLKYGREAYRTGTERLTSGSGLFGFGKRKGKSQEAASVNSGSFRKSFTSLQSASRQSESLPKRPDEELQQSSSDSAYQAIERDRQNQQRQIYLLETRLEKSVRLHKILSRSALLALVFSSLFLIASFLGDYRSYAHYFLIGNGVMGAIILWHLVEAALLGNDVQGKR